MINKIQTVPKIIFVDFDNTLSADIWSEEVDKSFFSQDNYVNWNSICKTNPRTYENCQPVPCIASIISLFNMSSKKKYP